MHSLFLSLLLSVGPGAHAGPLAGKTAIVTGTSSGIGRELAREAARRGMKLALVDIRPEGSRALAKELGGETIVIEADLAKPEDRERVVAETRARFKTIDALFNNAGYGYMATVEEFELDAAKRQFEVNFWAYVDLARRVYPEMAKRKSGTIVSVASLMGLIDGFERTAMYSASKHALVGWGRTVAPEFRRAGINFKVVCPTGVKTQFFEHLEGKGAKSVRDRIGDASEDFDDPARIAGDVFSSLDADGVFVFPGSAPEVMPEGLAALYP